MKNFLALLLLGLLALTLVPHTKALPMEDTMRAKRSPQEAADEEAEVTTPVWCNPSNPFR